MHSYIVTDAWSTYLSQLAATFLKSSFRGIIYILREITLSKDDPAASRQVLIFKIALSYRRRNRISYSQCLSNWQDKRGCCYMIHCVQKTYCLCLNSTRDNLPCVWVVAHPAGEVKRAVLCSDRMAIIPIRLGGARGVDYLSRGRHLVRSRLNNWNCQLNRRARSVR